MSKGRISKTPPSFGTRLNTEYILGMAKVGKNLKILLDIEKALTSDEIESVSRAAA